MCNLQSPTLSSGSPLESGGNDWSPVIVQSFSGHSLLKSENDWNSLSGWTLVDFDWTMTGK